MAGRTMDITTIACCTNLMNETSGLKAHRTLAPANATYTSRQMMLGGKGLERRERCCTAKPIEIAAITGQNILVSSRVSNGVASKTVYSNGETIVAKTHAKIGTIANLSIIPSGFGPLKAVRDAARVWGTS